VGCVGGSERGLTILQFQNEINYYKQKCDLGQGDEDMRNNYLWFKERLDLALMAKDNSLCGEERIPYGPEGEKDKFIPCRAVIPYGPAKPKNSSGRHKILFFGNPESGLEKIFEYCDRLSEPKPIYSAATWTVKSWEIQSVALIVCPVTEETFPTQKPFIQSFYEDAVGFVFVIDLKNSSQIEEIGKIMNEIVNDNNDEIKVPKVPVLILVNKAGNDQCTVEDIKKKLKIDELENKELKNKWKAQEADASVIDASVAITTDKEENSDQPSGSDNNNTIFHIQLCNIRENEGLYEGMDWIAENMKKGKEVIEVVHASGCILQ